MSAGASDRAGFIEAPSIMHETTYVPVPTPFKGPDNHELPPTLNAGPVTETLEIKSYRNFYAVPAAVAPPTRQPVTA